MTKANAPARPLLAGAATAQIGFPEGFFPHKSFRGRYFTSIHDPLHARALALEKDGSEIVLLSMELGDVDEGMVTETAKLAGIPENSLLMMATHTHSAPHAGGTWQEDVIDAEQSRAFRALCVAAAADAIKSARAKKQQAMLLIGTSLCNVNVNRDYLQTVYGESSYIQAPNPGGVSDKTVTVLKVAGMDGRTLAVLFNYGVHSNVAFFQTWTYEDSMQISSDLSGFAASYVEEHCDEGAVALFSLAPAADQMPRYLANHRVFARDWSSTWAYDGRDAAISLVEAQGSDLGFAVFRAMRNMMPVDLTGGVRIRQTTVTAMGKVKDGDRKAKSDAATGYMQQYDSRFEGAYEPTEPLTMRLNIVNLGKLIIVTVPCEIVTSIGVRLKQCAPAGHGSYMMVVSQCNGSYSYVSDRFGYEERTFEALHSHFMPGVSQLITDAVANCIESDIDKEKE